MPGWGDLVAREEERAVLDRLLDDVRHGRGRLVLVEGEAGIGKTRLAEYLVDAARPHADTASVTCWEAETLPAFWPWRRLLAALGTPLPDAGTVADPAAARVTLFDAVTDALAARATARPLVLLIDDSQWADELSRAYLRFVAPALRDLPVLVAAGVRTGEPAGDNLVAAGGRHAVRLSLGGLSRADLGRLVPDAPDLDDLHRRTAGNPLFARELAAVRDEPLPATVTAVLGRRVDRVQERDLLDVTAVVGEYAPLDVLAAILGLDLPACLARVERATGVVRLVDGNAVRFEHPLLRNVVLDRLGVAARARLHQRVAATLSERHGPLAELAGHYAAAAPAGSARDAVTYGVRAGDEALAMLGYEQAAALYDRALRCLDLAPDAHDRTDLLLRLGSARTAAGHQDKARQAFLDAAAEARKAGDPPRFATAALAVGSGEGFEVTLFDEEQQALLVEAIGLVGDTDAASRARLVARLSVARSLTEPTERRHAAAEEALALARKAADDTATCDALAALCDAVAGPDDAERRVDLATDLVGIATRRDDVRRELLGRRLLVVAHLERGDVRSVDAEIDAYAIAAARLRSPLYSWYVPLWRAMRAWMTGDLDAGRRLLAQAEAIGHAAGSYNAAMLVTAARAIAAVDDGEMTDVLLDTFPDDIGLGLWVAVARGLGFAGLGRHDEARRLLDAAAPALPDLPRDSEYLPTLVQAALTASLVGGHPVAAYLYDALLPHRHRFAVEGIGAYCHGSVERHLALLAPLTGRDPAPHVAAAVDANAGSPRLVALARAAATTAIAGAGDGEFHRSGESWVVGLGGQVAHIRDSKGMRDLATLLAAPGRAVAALDLLGAPVANDTGDLIDARARAAYKQRIEDLDGEIDDADLAADLARGERARAERDALVAELTAAYGLGGRVRKTGDPAERARTTVTARIRDALRRIETAEPGAGAHLRRSVRTGTFCTYDPIAPVQWRLTP